MNHFIAFHTLNISITKDVSAIKKAYQQQLAHHHPEEDPDGFMQLHQAYKAALSYAQGTKPTVSFSFDPHSRQPGEQPVRESATDYDSLFSNLDAAVQESSPAPCRKKFSQKLDSLTCKMLPISLDSWQNIFGSEEYLLCRGDGESMEQLFNLLVKKIHTCKVLHFLLYQLWELYDWQTAQDEEAPADKTLQCITALQKQYRHYLKRDPESRLVRWFFQWIWYYQAIPFLLKLFLSTCLFLVPFKDGETVLRLLSGFHILELWICHKNKARSLSLAHPRFPWQGRLFYDDFVNNRIAFYGFILMSMMIQLAFYVFLL